MYVLKWMEPHYIKFLSQVLFVPRKEEWLTLTWELPCTRLWEVQDVIYTLTSCEVKLVVQEDKSPRLVELSQDLCGTRSLLNLLFVVNHFLLGHTSDWWFCCGKGTANAPLKMERYLETQKLRSQLFSSPYVEDLTFTFSHKAKRQSSIILKISISTC